MAHDNTLMGRRVQAFDIVFVFLSLITHPSSQYAFVADLAAGGISPPESLRYTAGARVQGSKRCSVMHGKPYAQRLMQ